MSAESKIDTVEQSDKYNAVVIKFHEALLGAQELGCSILVKLSEGDYEFDAKHVNDITLF